MKKLPTPRHAHQLATGRFGPYTVEVYRRQTEYGTEEDFHAAIKISDQRGFFGGADKSGMVAIYKLAAEVTARYQGNAPVCVNAGQGVIYIESDTREEALSLVHLLIKAANAVLGVEWSAVHRDYANQARHTKTHRVVRADGQPVNVTIPE